MLQARAHLAEVVTHSGEHTHVWDGEAQLRARMSELYSTPIKKVPSAEELRRLSRAIAGPRHQGEKRRLLYSAPLMARNAALSAVGVARSPGQEPILGCWA